MRKKLKKARQTGAGAQDDLDEGEELLYQILRKNGSVAAAVKVGKMLQKSERKVNLTSLFSSTVQMSGWNWQLRRHFCHLMARHQIL